MYEELSQKKPDLLLPTSSSLSLDSTLPAAYNRIRSSAYPTDINLQGGFTGICVAIAIERLLAFPPEKVARIVVNLEKIRNSPDDRGIHPENVRARRTLLQFTLRKMVLDNPRLIITPAE